MTHSTSHSFHVHKIGPPLIWASVGELYPRPHEAVILLSGGAQMSVFKNLYDNIHRLSLLHFGKEEAMTAKYSH